MTKEEYVVKEIKRKGFDKWDTQSDGYILMKFSIEQYYDLLKLIEGVYISFGNGGLPTNLKESLYENL